MISFNRRIVRILEEGALVDMNVLAEAAQVASQADKSVTEYLLEKKLFEEGDLLGILADRLGVPPIDPDKIEPPADLREKVPLELARSVGCIPVTQYDGILTVAVSNPFDVLKHDDLRLHFGLGRAESADIEVHWPSGIVDRFTAPADRIVTVAEGRGVLAPKG